MAKWAWRQNYKNLPVEYGYVQQNTSGRYGQWVQDEKPSI